MRLRLRNYGTLFIIWLSALGASAWGAQQPAPAVLPAASQEPAAAPEVIRVTDIIPRSERVLIQLRDIRNALDADNSTSVIEAALPEFTRKSDEWWLGEAAAIEQLHSVQRLNDVTWQLNLYDGQVAAWNNLLAASSKKWSTEKETLEGLLKEWQATKASLDNTAPQAVKNKIDQVLDEGDTAQIHFQQKTAQLVAVQDKLASRLSRLNDIRYKLDSARVQSAENLFALDSPTLWTALLSADKAPSFSEQADESLKKLYRDAVGFYEIYGGRLLLHLVLALLLPIGFFRLRRLSLNTGEFAPTDAERYVLDRPAASAILVALLLTPLLYPDVSPQTMRLLVIPVVIPLLMLLPAIFAPSLRTAYFLLMAVYMLEYWRYYLPTQWWLVRVLLLVEAVLGIGATYIVYRTKVTEPVEPSRRRVHQLVLRVVFGLLIAAIVANLAGDFTLAEFLISPIVRTLYVGIAIQMLILVATTFAIVALYSHFAAWFRTVQQRRTAVVRQIRRFANIVGAILWIVIGVFNIGALGFVERVLESIFGAQWKLGATQISISSIVIFFMVFGTAYVLSRILRFILAEEIFPRFHMPRGVPDALELLSRYGVLLFGFLFALVSAGVNLSQLTLALSALGVGIGFGLQNIVNNFVCGLILVFEHPIQVGDFVEVGSHFGQVQRIGFRSSSVNTPDGGNVIIPNSELIGNKVMNWSLSDQLRRITLRIPVPLDTEPKRMIDMFQGIARSNSDVVSYPAPSAALEKLGDGSLNFILRCWTPTEKHEATGFKLTLAINEALQAAGIQIPFPQSDVHLHWPGNAGSEAQSDARLNELTAGAGTPKSTARS